MVDYVMVVDNNAVALCEAKSLSVMQKVGRVLLEHGIALMWSRGQSLIPNILTEVSTPSLSIIALVS